MSILLDPRFIIFVFAMGVFLTASGAARWVGSTTKATVKDQEGDRAKNAIEEIERRELKFGGMMSSVSTMIIGIGLVLLSAAFFLTWLVDRAKS